MSTPSRFYYKYMAYPPGAKPFYIYRFSLNSDRRTISELRQTLSLNPFPFHQQLVLSDLYWTDYSLILILLSMSDLHIACKQVKSDYGFRFLDETSGVFSDPWIEHQNWHGRKGNLQPTQGLQTLSAIAHALVDWAGVWRFHYELWNNKTNPIPLHDRCFILKHIVPL